MNNDKQVSALALALHEAQQERDQARAELGEASAQLATARAALSRLAAWEQLNVDGHAVTLVGGEGGYEYPFHAFFADDFRAERYCEWLRTIPTPETGDDDAESYTVELFCDHGRIASTIAFWNRTTDPELPIVGHAEASS